MRAPRPIRVSVVGLRGVPDVPGGVEAHCEQLYGRMAADADLDITILARKPYIRERQAFMFRGARVVPTWSLRSKYLETIVHTGYGVVLARLRYRADIVHIHAIGPALWAPVARALGLNVVVTHHGEDYRSDKWNRFARWVLRTGERSAVRFADAVIVVNETVGHALREQSRGATAQIRHLPNGYDRFDSGGASAEPSPLDELGLSPGKYLLAVGRLVPGKGFDDLIDAHAAGNLDMPLVIAGGADHAGEYSRGLLRRGGRGVIFAGFQPKARLRALYEGAGLFVSASNHEGDPIAVLEAIGLGTPVLLSDIAPHLKLGLSPAHYFPVGDIAALAGKMAAPATEYRHGGADLLAGREWDEVAAATASIYKSIAKSTG